MSVFTVCSLLSEPTLTLSPSCMYLYTLHSESSHRPSLYGTCKNTQTCARVAEMTLWCSFLLYIDMTLRGLDNI